jgi:hypothetical protein
MLVSTDKVGPQNNRISLLPVLRFRYIYIYIYINLLTLNETAYIPALCRKYR